MNAKELQKYNRSRRKYHHLLAKELGRQVVQHILHKARKIQKLYRLEANATEEIEQELAIAANKARNTWTPEINAQKRTFVLAAVNNHSAYLARCLSGLPIMENYESGMDIREVGQLHKIVQKNIRKMHDKNNAMYPPPIFTDKKQRARQKRMQRKERPKIKPSVVSCGAELARQVTSKPTCDYALKLDIEAVIVTLTPRQQTIISMLNSGYTQEEIAKELNVTQPRIVQIAITIHRKFSVLQNNCL